MKKKNYSKAIIALTLFPLSAMAANIIVGNKSLSSIQIDHANPTTYRDATVTSTTATSGKFITYKGSTGFNGKTATLTFDNSKLKPNAVNRSTYFIYIGGTNFDSTTAEISFINNSVASYATLDANGYPKNTSSPITIGKATTISNKPAKVNLNIESSSKVQAGAFILGDKDDKNPHREYILNMEEGSLEVYSLSMYYGATNPASYADYYSNSYVFLNENSTLKSGYSIIVSGAQNAIGGNSSIILGDNNTIDTFGNIQIGTQSGKNGGTASIDVIGDNNLISAKGSLFAIGGASQKNGTNSTVVEGDNNKIFALNNLIVGYGNSKKNGTNEFIITGNNNLVDVGTSFYVGYGNNLADGNNYALFDGESIDFRVGTIANSNRRLFVGASESQTGGTNRLDIVGTSVDEKDTIEENQLGKPQEYSKTMKVYTCVRVCGNRLNSEDILLAYVGDELRGKQNLSVIKDENDVNKNNNKGDDVSIAEITINVAKDGEEITFYIYDKSEKLLYPSYTTLIAKANDTTYKNNNALIVDQKLKGIRMHSIRVGDERRSQMGGRNTLYLKGTKNTSHLDFSNSSIFQKSMLVNFFSNDSIHIFGSNKVGSTVVNEMILDGNVGVFVNGDNNNGANINMFIGHDSDIKGGIARLVLANNTEDANCGNMLKIWNFQIGNLNMTGGESILELDGDGSYIGIGTNFNAFMGKDSTFEAPKGAHIIYKPSQYGISTIEANQVHKDASFLMTIDLSKLKDLPANSNFKFYSTFFKINSSPNPNDATGIRIDELIKTMWENHRFRVLGVNGEEVILEYHEEIEGDEYEEIKENRKMYFTYYDETNSLTLQINLSKTTAVIDLIIEKPKPVTIEFQPANLEKFANENAFFEVIVDGTNPSYQWQYSADGNTWEDIEGAINSFYEIPSVSESDTGYYKCIVSNAYGDPVTSDSAQLTVKPSPFKTQPADFYIRYDGSQNPTATFTFEVKEEYKKFENPETGEKIQYSWYVSEYDFDTDSYLPEVPAYNDPNATGWDTNTLVIKNIAPRNYDGIPTYNHNIYYCKIILEYSEEPITNGAELLVETMEIVNDNMQDSYYIYAGSAPTFKFSAKKILQDTDNITYQWYVNKNDGNGFVEIDKATSTSFNPYATASSDGWQYVCVATNGLERKYSNYATVNIRATPKIASQSKSVAIYEGHQTTLKVNVTGGYEPLTYQWYQQISKKESILLENANGPEYVVDGVEANDGASFYCVITDSNSKKLTSSTIKTPMRDAVAFDDEKGAINVQQKVGVNEPINETYQYQSEPIAQDIYAEYPATFTVNATGYSVRYQWYTSYNGEDWTEITRATKKSYQIKAPEANSFQYLKCQIYNLNDKDIATSEDIVIALNVKECPAPTALSSQALRFIENGNSVFDFIPISKSKCIILADDGSSITTSYTYKRTSPTLATFKLTAKALSLSISGTMEFSEEDGSIKISSYEVEKLSVENGNMPNYLDIILDPDLPEYLKLYNKTKTTLEANASTLEGVPLTYIWYVNKNDGKGFVSAGSKKRTLSITPTDKMLPQEVDNEDNNGEQPTGWSYYCEVSNGYNTIRTTTASLVSLTDKVLIKPQPKSITVFDDDSIGEFTTTVIGGYNPQYKWQVSYNGKDWFDIEDNETATSPTLKIVGENYKGMKPRFRCEIWDEGLKVLTSTTVSATVREAARLADNPPVTVTQKIGKVTNTYDIVEDVCDDAIEYYPITMTINATGYALKYQWYTSYNGEDWTEIAKATKKAYTISKPEYGVKKYKCKVYNLNGKNPGTEAEYQFTLDVDFMPTPVALTGLIYDIKDGDNVIATIAPSSASACKLVSPDPSLVFNTSTMSYKANTTTNTATLKLTLTYSKQTVAGEPSKDKPKKVILNGVVTFDENGDGTFVITQTNDEIFTKDVYTLERKLSTKNLLPANLINKKILFEGTTYNVDKTGKKLTDDAGTSMGTVTYKYISQNVATLTLKLGKVTYSNGIFFVNEDDLSYYITAPNKAFIQGDSKISDIE